MRLTTVTPLDWMPEALLVFVRRRTAEAGGLTQLAAVAALGAALCTWSVQDPSWNHAVDRPTHNILGAGGAVAADLVMQLCGLGIVAVLPVLACWGITLLLYRELSRPRLRAGLLVAGGLAAAGLASALPATDRWPLPTGLGGVIGDAVLAIPNHIIGHSAASLLISATSLAAVAILTLTAAAGFGLRRPAREEEDVATAYDWIPVPKTDRRPADEEADEEPGLGLVSLGAAIHAGLAVKGALLRAVKRRLGQPSSPEHPS
ncbi:MAG: DNA translocase FtsK 4TM domain-containing protein, partial [Actinomycetospora chiangmaiensis]|nr:DNA translocase FtsK 4TM domain-containing protein [Actinomycetospora chiangmaiensis]